MQIKQYNPSQVVDGELVYFIPQVVTVRRDGDRASLRYGNRIKFDHAKFKVISAMFDKTSNRVRLTCDVTPHDPTNTLVGIKRLAKTRSIVDVRLQLPRGAFSNHYTSVFDVIDLGAHDSDNLGTVRSVTGTNSQITDIKLYEAIRQALYPYFTAFYVEHGCPAEVDRRRVPSPIKEYTGELRQQWRIQQHSFSYPASGLSTVLVDSMCGYRQPRVTMQQLIDWHLLPTYPRLTIKSTKKAGANSKTGMDFIGVYRVGGDFSKNAQLIHKLSMLMPTPPTLQELEASLDEVVRSTAMLNENSKPYLWCSPGDTRMFFLGTTKTETLGGE